MINAELSLVAEKLKAATRPEDVFGKKAEDVQRVFRRLVKVCYPDRYQADEDKVAAKDAFECLTKWREQADAKCEHGTYGTDAPVPSKAPAVITIETKKCVYALTDLIAAGDLCDVYRCHWDGVPEGGFAKVVRNPRNNDLMKAEVETLKVIVSGLKATQHPNPEENTRRYPEVIDSVTTTDAAGVKRAVNILKHEPGLVTLSTVMAKFNGAVDMRDLAWMASRTLVAMGLAHRYNVIHCAITPDHIIVHPETHQGVLIDWCYAVMAGNPAKAVSPKWEKLYPPEVKLKKSLGASTDTYMWASTFVEAAGGIRNIPLPISKVLEGCLIASPFRRESSAWELFDNFKSALSSVYGKPKYRKLATS
jgi:hypothetical protein